MHFIDRGIAVPCHLNIGTYDRTGNIFIDVIAQYQDGDSQYCALTILPTNEVLPYGYGYLNPLFPYGEKFIEQNNLGEPTGREIISGVNVVAEYKFNMDLLFGDEPTSVE